MYIHYCVYFSLSTRSTSPAQRPSQTSGFHYIGSPAAEIHDGVTEVRENLAGAPALGRKHAVYDEMRAMGLTDYVAWPIHHTLGKRHIVTFATDRCSIADEIDLCGFRKSTLFPDLASLAEDLATRRI